MDGQIPHSRPTITDDDQVLVGQQLSSEWLASGSRTVEFENLVARRHGYDRITSASSGRAALQVLLKASDIGKGDEVMLSTYVCSSVLEAVVQTGATPIFYDIDETWSPSASSIESKLSPRTRVVIVVHIFGIDGSLPCLDHLPVFVIDDLCQAYGVVPRYSPGHASFFSFNATKCITTGEGGAFFIRSDLQKRTELVKSRLSDLQAALGVSQERQYDEFLLRRKKIAQFYLSEMPDSILESTLRVSERTCWFRFPITIKNGFLGFSNAMAAHGVSVRRGVDKLLHLEFGEQSTCRNAERIYAETASLPIYPSLTDGQVEFVCRAVKQSLNL